jgi:hypothetical protein
MRDSDACKQLMRINVIQRGFGPIFHGDR